MALPDNAGYWIEVGAFADRLSAYMATRITPWQNEAEMMEAVRTACQFIFGEALDDVKRIMATRSDQRP